MKEGERGKNAKNAFFQIRSSWWNLRDIARIGSTICHIYTIQMAKVIGAIREQENAKRANFFFPVGHFFKARFGVLNNHNNSIVPHGGYVPLRCSMSRPYSHNGGHNWVGMVW